MNCNLGNKCIAKSSPELLKCLECKKRYIHVDCFKHSLRIFGDEEYEGNVVCGKRCYSKTKKPKPKKKDGKRPFWHSDGPTPDVNSLIILIDWLTTGNNYSQWKGGDFHSGITKMTLAGIILTEIKDKGITTTRTSKDVLQKISNMEHLYKQATDFLDGTGAGITCEQSLQEAVKKICPYYYELAPIMSDGPSIGH